jgi:hypothetical protein
VTQSPQGTDNDKIPEGKDKEDRTTHNDDGKSCKDLLKEALTSDPFQDT